MSLPRWKPLGPDTALGTLLAQVGQWMKANDASLVGGDRAHTALDSTATLVTAVDGAATVAGKPARGIAAVYGVDWMETFDAVPSDYLTLAGTPSQDIGGTGQTGGSALRQTGTVSQAFPYALPYDASKQHRLRARVKRVSGAGTFSYGVQALDASGTVLGTYAIGASGAAPGGAYTEYTGWLTGFAAPTQPANTPTLPSGLPVGTVSVRPFYTLNTGAPSGVMHLDYVAYEQLDEDATARLYTSLLATTDPRYATGARVTTNGIDTGAMQAKAATNPKLGDDAADSRVIAADVVIVGQLVNNGGTYYLDLRNGLGAGARIVQLPGFLADNLGNATFSGALSAASGTFTGALSGATGTFSGTVTAGGVVAAGSFTAALAVFNGDLAVSGSTQFLGDVLFALGTTVTMASGFAAGPSTIDLLRVGTGGASGASIALECTGTSGGFQHPRLTTTQRNALTGGPGGLTIFNTSTSKVETWDGATWQAHW